VDLFEQLRREHEFGVGTVAGVAAKFGVHRRMVRQAIAGALPPPHVYPQRVKPKLDGVMAFIDAVLDEDRRAPRKQRHTARRIHRRHCQLVGLRSQWRTMRAACSWLRRSGDAGDLGPNLKGLGPGGSILGGGHLMAAEVEEVVDPVVGGEETLCLAG